MTLVRVKILILGAIPHIERQTRLLFIGWVEVVLKNSLRRLDERGVKKLYKRVV
jgi:hypothetical protein